MIRTEKTSYTIHFWLGRMILCWFRKCDCGIKHQRTILAGTLVHDSTLVLEIIRVESKAQDILAGTTGTAHTWFLLVPELIVWNEAFTRHSGWDNWSCTHVISAGSRTDSVEWSFYKTFWLAHFCVHRVLIIRVWWKKPKIVGQTAHQISLLNFVAADWFMAWIWRQIF
jgi:hypothetical protein